MLTNEAKRQAESIRPQVAELLDILGQAAKVWEKKGAKYRAADSLWYAWQHFPEYRARDEQPEQAEKAKQARETNPREWSAAVERLSEKRERARVALYVSRVNFQNLADYTAKRIAELVRPFWRLVSLRKGAEDLGALLTPKYKDKDKDTAHAFRLWFKISGGNVGAQLFPSSFIRLDCHICPRGIACGISGSVEGVKMGEDVPDTPKEKAAPHWLTVAEYLRAVEKLEQLKNKAEKVAAQCARESRELVRSLGLYGFAEFLNSYRLDFGR